MAKLIAYISFLVMVLHGQPLRADAIFQLLALTNAVRLTLTMFPTAIEMVAETRVALKRIQVVDL